MTSFSQPITTVPSSLPPHPPYNEMIRSAIVGLKDKDGSSRQAISKFIEKEFGHTNLPPTNSVMLTHHLKRMREEGQLVMVKHSYMLPPSAGSVAYNGNDVNNNNTNNNLDFSNPSGGASNVNGSSLAKRKPGRPAKVRPVPGSGVQNVQVLHDANMQQSYQPPFPFHQVVQGQGAGFEGSNVGGGGGGGAEPLFVSLGLGDEGVAVQSAEKESTGVKRGRGRPAKKTGSVGRPAKKGGSVGRPAKKVGLDGLAATGENGGSEVQGVVSEAKEVAGGDEVKKVADGGDETEGEKRGRGRPRRKAKMISVPTGGNGRLPRARSRPVRLGSAPVTVPLAGNVLRPRGRPKRFGRPVVNGVSVRGSRRPRGRPSVNKVTNLTGLELARPAKDGEQAIVYVGFECENRYRHFWFRTLVMEDGPGTAVLVTDPRQLVVYQELMSKYELLQSKVKQVAGVVKSCIDPTYGSTALGALQELEALAGGDANAPSHVQT
ncbi:histone H5, AT hook-like protein [Tanacetum coccineum]